MHEDVMIRAEGVSKKFPRSLAKTMHYGLRDLLGEIWPRGGANGALRPDEFWAVKDVSFELKRGDTLALMGPNGAGKSTLLRMLMGRPKLTAGRISIHAHVAAITELGAGFNPLQTGLENIYNNSAVLGVPRHRVRDLIDQIVDFAGLADFLDMPVQNYSAGMRARLGFAIAAHVNPEVLLIDEALAVGDLGFKRKCLRRLMQYTEQGGSLIAVAHDMYSLQQLCRSCILLHEGQVLFQGPIVEGIQRCFGLFRDIEKCDVPERVVHDEAPVDCPAPQSQLQDACASLTNENPIHIESITIESLEGGPIQSEGAARVHVDYQSLIEIKSGFVWGFTLLTADQMIRIGSGIRLTENPAYRIHQGKGRLSCVIPRLPLCAGQYAISAAIIESDTRRSIARRGYDEPAPAFQVVAPANALNNIRSLRGELVTLDVVWDGER